MPYCRSPLPPAAAALALLTLGPAVTAYAVDYSARGNLGLYQSSETYGTASGGDTTNDQRMVLSSLYFDAQRLGPLNNEFTLDLRDKYDFFGRVDAYNSRLVADNEPSLRELSIKEPYDNGRVEWKLGRFPVANASVLGNDGAEVGYKVSSRVAIGGFGGLYPENINGVPIPVGEEDKQGGVFATYQDKGTAWGKNTYATTSFVLRQPNPITDGTNVPVAAPPTPLDPTQPTTVNDSVPTNNYVFWYTNVVYQPAPETRFTYLAHVDIEPEVHFRDIWASAYRQFSQRLSGTLSILHIDLTEYERQRDLSDVLPSSVFNQVRVEPRYKLTRTMELVVDADAGERSLDSKTRYEIDGKLVATSLANGHLAAWGGGGLRKNYLSHDDLVKLGANYYGSKLELDLTQQYIIENYDPDYYDGQVLHQLITDVDADFMLTENLMGSIGIEYAHDELVTITSGILTIGFRLNNRQLTPVRDRAPRLERTETL